jgi:hypothetical protein
MFLGTMVTLGLPSVMAFEEAAAQTVSIAGTTAVATWLSLGTYRSGRQR